MYRKSYVSDCQVMLSGLIEIAIVVAMLAALLKVAAVKNWFARIGRTERRIVTGVVALLLAGQLLAQSRKTFPFVRWDMYTEVYENEPIEVGKFQALHADGTTRWVNPLRYYPSLTRNLHHRLMVFTSCAADDELSPLLDRTFGKLMMAIGQRYNESHPGNDNPMVEIQAVLQSVHVQGGKVIRTNRVVKRQCFRVCDKSDDEGGP